MAELSPERIAKAALALVDRKGVEGFTLRAVADRLGVTPMALYHHVPDKAALAALVVDTAISARPLAPSTGSWKDDLWELARWMRESALAHPALAHLRRTYKVWTPSMLRLTERWLGLWRQSGLDPQQAVMAATASSLAITGLVNEESIIREMDRPKEAVLHMLPDARLMFSARLDPDRMFELAVRSIIDGVHARLSKP